MIVTRRRRKPFPWKMIVIPCALVAVLAGALIWPVSRGWISKQAVVGNLTKPFDAAAQMQSISSRNAQIAALQQQLDDARNQIADRDKQISSLQSQLNAAQQEAAMAKAVKPRSQGAPQNASADLAQASAPDLATQATPDMRRTASVWSAMDADSAAKVVQRLPDDYVARIFAIMPSDSVGAILEDAPVAYAARLTRDRPELRR